MVRLAITFFIIALIAFVLGAYGIAGLSMEIGKILLVVFLALAIISYLGGNLRGRKPR